MCLHCQNLSSALRSCKPIKWGARSCGSDVPLLQWDGKKHWVNSPPVLGSFCCVLSVFVGCWNKEARSCSILCAVWHHSLNPGDLNIWVWLKPSRFECETAWHTSQLGVAAMFVAKEIQMFSFLGSICAKRCSEDERDTACLFAAEASTGVNVSVRADSTDSTNY